MSLTTGHQEWSQGQLDLRECAESQRDARLDQCWKQIQRIGQGSSLHPDHWRFQESMLAATQLAAAPSQAISCFCCDFQFSLINICVIREYNFLNTTQIHQTFLLYSMQVNFRSSLKGYLTFPPTTISHDLLLIDIDLESRFSFVF